MFVLLHVEKIDEHWDCELLVSHAQLAGSHVERYRANELGCLDFNPMAGRDKGLMAGCIMVLDVLHMDDVEL